MDAIKGLINAVLKDLETKVSTHDPEEALKKALTKKDLGHIKVNYFKNGVLSVNVDSSARLYKLKLEKKELLEKLGREPCAIRDVRFRIGAVK
ncbi:MAG: DUF721 domain-containing protein [Candidatus Omnitrophica bacterium]|nr:DUF721 domain-containing protein [Candidatus Omnitrophota bacterium]